MIELPLGRSTESPLGVESSRRRVGSAWIIGAVGNGEPEHALSRINGPWGVAHAKSGGTADGRWHLHVGCQVRAGKSGEAGIERYVLSSTHRLLAIADVHKVGGTIASFLPRGSTDEEDGDEGKQDENDDGQFEDRHPGCLFFCWAGYRFHGVLYSI